MGEGPAVCFDDLLSVLPDLAAEARDRASEFEEARNIAPDFVAKLKSAGAYRVLVAREQGGIGGSLTEWLHMATTLAEADASTGWTTGHGAICSALVANIAETSFVDDVLSDPMSSIAWSNLPRVRVVRETDGVWIDGRWSFATGSANATYVGGMFDLPPAESGREVRKFVALAPIGSARIDLTWDPVGLAGTGSHDVVFDNVFVPWERVFEWPHSKPKVDLPTAVFVPGTWFISMCAAATHLGLARRMLDEVRNELRGKKDRWTGLPLIDEQAVQRGLEEGEGLLYVCRAGVERSLSAIWMRGQNGCPVDDALRIDARLACTTCVHQCAEIVRSAYGLAGASATRRSGVIQRLLRDASCLIHHVSVAPKTFEEIGGVRSRLQRADGTAA